MTNIPIVVLSGAQLMQSPANIDTETGLITVPTILPVNQNHLSTKEYVDQSTASLVTQAQLDQAVQGLAPRTEITRLNAILGGKAPISLVEEVAATLLPLTGGEVTGPIHYAPAPVDDSELANKSYVDDTLTTNLGNYLTEAQGNALYLPLTGGTVTGAITLPADPVTDMQAATKQYVDSLTGDLDGYVDIGGDTMTGPLILNAAPTEPAHAVTKEYVDNVFAAFVATRIS